MSRLLVDIRTITPKSPAIIAWMASSFQQHISQVRVFDGTNLAEYQLEGDPNRSFIFKELKSPAGLMAPENRPLKSIFRQWKHLEAHHF